MRRREQPPPSLPPAELLTFVPGTWAAFIEEQCPSDHHFTTDEAWRSNAEFKVWADARDRWAKAHGWHVDSVERIRDQRRQRLALIAEPRITPPPADQPRRRSR